jgi:hypothetical protein
MKFKLIQFMAVITIVATAFFGMSSFISADEEGQIGKTETAKECLYECYYVDPDGTISVRYIPAFYVACDPVTYQHVCQEEECIPMEDCPLPG